MHLYNLNQRTFRNVFSALVLVTLGAVELVEGVCAFICQTESPSESLSAPHLGMGRVSRVHPRTLVTDTPIPMTYMGNYTREMFG